MHIKSVSLFRLNEILKPNLEGSRFQIISSRMGSTSGGKFGEKPNEKGNRFFFKISGNFYVYRQVPDVRVKSAMIASHQTSFHVDMISQCMCSSHIAD